MTDMKNKIDDVVEAFYRQLPEADYPKALIEGYPRIASRIYSLRGNKPALQEYFDSLLTDERGGRAGFPFPIIVSIQNLFDIMVGIPDGFVDTDRIFTGFKKLK